MERLVECVPNFSEGKDQSIITAISNAISSVSGVELLDVDPGADTNRTVVTLVGSPDAAIEAAFQAIKTAQILIDMQKHKGAHPRMGATDVCPFIPVAGLSIEECVEIARTLGRRVGDELKIPVYLYEYAASTPERRNLADIRQGEYEGLSEKIVRPEWKPDFGPAEFNAKSGATVIGSRKFLIAYNVNVNSRNTRLAHNIALDIREKGRWVKSEGKISKDEHGNKLRKPGLLKACKAVGWYIKEYDRAQVSINLTDFEKTPPHLAFDTCADVAPNYGLRVTGSELVGLIPLEAMNQAGKHYLKKQGVSTGIPERMIIETAIQSLGLNEISPFDPDEKIIEYRIAKNENRPLVKMTVKDFCDELSTDSPAPGGGSVAALCGALSASLSAMVANLTSGKKGMENTKDKMIEVADSGQKLKDSFIKDVDDDTNAFNELMDSFALSKNDKEQKKIRNCAIQSATKKAILVPLGALEKAVLVMDLAEVVAREGNPNSISDAGVSILTAKAAGEGAYMNVVINLDGITDEAFSTSIREKANDLRLKLNQRYDELIEVINRALKIPPVSTGLS